MSLSAVELSVFKWGEEWSWDFRWESYSRIWRLDSYKWLHSVEMTLFIPKERNSLISSVTDSISMLLLMLNG